MHRILICLLLMVIVVSSYCQRREMTTIKSGENIAAYKDYLYPSFTDGKVTGRQGGDITAKLNFSMLICKMEFIDPSGDTLVIKDPENILSIKIDSNLFYYNKGYKEIVADYDTVKLAVFRKVSYEPVKRGAFGVRNKSSSVQDYSTLLSYKGATNLSMDEDIDVKKETTFLLVFPDWEERVANKSNIIKLLKPVKSDIENFIKKEKINFNEEADLKKVLTYGYSN